jgi:hypothetical protein
VKAVANNYFLSIVLEADNFVFAWVQELSNDLEPLVKVVGFEGEAEGFLCVECCCVVLGFHCVYMLCFISGKSKNYF